MTEKTNQQRKRRTGRRADVSDTATAAGALWPLLVGGACVILAILITAVRPIMDPDTWFHLAFGRLVLEEDTFPRADVFSHTSPGNEWISSGWLASVLMYKLHQVGESGAALIWMSFAIALAAYGLAYVAVARWFGGAGTMATLLVLGAGISIARFSPRPDIWSQLGICLVMLILLSADRADKKYPRRLWLLVPVMVAWANLHAGFMVGLLVIAIYGLWQFAKATSNEDRWNFRNWGPLWAAALAWMLNPYGPKLLDLARKIRAIPEVGWVYEWMPLFRSGFLPPWSALVLIALFTLLVVAVAVVGRKRLVGWHWGVLALFVVLALLQRRQVGLASVAIPLALAPALPAFENWLGRTRKIMLAVAVAALVLVGAFHHRGLLLSDRSFLRVGINCTALPCDATDYLTQFRPPGNMFNSYGLGGFLLFHLAPETKVFIDGRLDVYDHQVWRDYLAVDDGRLEIAAVEERYGVKSWVLDISEAVNDPQHLASRLATAGKHALVYFDDQVAVFISRDALAPPHQELTHVSPWKAATLMTLRGAELDVAATEAQRALEYSNGSASAWALAAVVAKAAGNQQATAVALQQAQARNDKNPVLQNVRNLIK